MTYPDTENPRLASFAEACIQQVKKNAGLPISGVSSSSRAGATGSEVVGIESDTPDRLNNKPAAERFWAIADTELEKDPFPITRWTYHRDAGKRIGLMAIYDKKPTIPKKWRKFKRIIRVLITPL